MAAIRIAAKVFTCILFDAQIVYRCRI